MSISFKAIDTDAWTGTVYGSWDDGLTWKRGFVCDGCQRGGTSKVVAPPRPRLHGHAASAAPCSSPVATGALGWSRDSSQPHAVPLRLCMCDSEAAQRS